MVELIGKSRINGLEVHITNEDMTSDVDIPTHKVEEGIDLSDHVERKPFVIKLSGFLLRPTKDRVDTLIKKLEQIENQGSLVVYQGRRTHMNLLMSGFNYSADEKVTNGYKFSCILTEVRIAQSAYVPPLLKSATSKVSQSGRKQTENKKQSPIYHIIKKGDTYSGLAKKYGVQLKQIQAWNKYNQKKIPIGAKVKVG